MREINIVNLISKLIKDYEKVHGIMKFEVKKIDHTFVFTNVDQKLLNFLKISQDCIVGKTLSDLPINKDSVKKLPAIYEKAWNGEEMFDYKVFSTNKDIVVVYTIKPVLKSGKTDKLEGHCVLLDAKDFKGYL